MELVYFTCTEQDLVPIATTPVRWLAPDADYELAEAYWRAHGQNLGRSTWLTAHEVGYRYCAIIENDRAVSIAGVWKFSDEAWEVAAVGTLEGYRRRGYSKRCVAFITAFILEAGQTATCRTSVDNTAMIATAKSVGFQVIPEDKVWWKFPKLPDF
jgi:predicted GNAT family acetyltransferase